MSWPLMVMRPSDLPAPPVYRKVNPADVPILTLAVTSESLPLPAVYDLVDTRMTQRLAQLSGVGSPASLHAPLAGPLGNRS